MSNFYGEKPQDLNKAERYELLSRKVFQAGQQLEKNERYKLVGFVDQMIMDELQMLPLEGMRNALVDQRLPIEIASFYADYEASVLNVEKNVRKRNASELAFLTFYRIALEKQLNPDVGSTGLQRIKGSLQGIQSTLLHGDLQPAQKLVFFLNQAVIADELLPEIPSEVVTGIPRVTKSTVTPSEDRPSLSKPIPTHRTG